MLCKWGPVKREKVISTARQSMTGADFYQLAFFLVLLLRQILPFGRCCRPHPSVFFPHNGSSFLLLTTAAFMLLTVF